MLVHYVPFIVNIRANPKYYADTTVFYNTYDPNDKLRKCAFWMYSFSQLNMAVLILSTGGNYTVDLYYQVSPYGTAIEVDPNLGRHDGFLMVGPYIFAQKTVNSVVGLYISYKRSLFKKALIPSNDPHQVEAEFLP